MKRIHTSDWDRDNLASLRGGCANCHGLCCAALYFSKLDGFPEDKAAGTPCRHLAPDFGCNVHPLLADMGLRGCMAYDCFGAGQLVASGIYSGCDFLSSPQLAMQIFSVFHKVCGLRQMLWYLTEAKFVIAAAVMHDEISTLIAENERITQLSPEEILAFPTDPYKTAVDTVLKKTSETVRSSISGSHKRKKSYDLIGKNFKGAVLHGEDFSMSLLIGANFKNCVLYGANFLGADIRGADFSGADLRECLFLTEWQLNSANGSLATQIPDSLCLPDSWKNR